MKKRWPKIVESLFIMGLGALASIVTMMLAVQSGKQLVVAFILFPVAMLGSYCLAKTEKEKEE